VRKTALFRYYCERWNFFEKKSIKNINIPEWGSIKYYQISIRKKNKPVTGAVAFIFAVPSRSLEKNNK
jgi:hypothetical protein